MRRLCSDDDGERKEAEEDEEKEEEENDDDKEKKLKGTPKHDNDDDVGGNAAPGDYDGDGAEDGSAGECSLNRNVNTFNLTTLVITY